MKYGIMHISLICLLFMSVEGVCRAATPIDPVYSELAQFLSRGQEAMMPRPGNDLDIITYGTRKWELLTADLESAQQYICMEYYRWREDDAGRQIRNIIVRKLQEGVQVKILLDDVANSFVHKDYYLSLRSAGAQVQFFTDTDHQLWEMLPGINNRDHRKIVVIDGRVGYIGGMNLGLPNRDVWQDTHLRIQGAAVGCLEKLFDDMWDARKGPFLKRQEARMPTSSQDPSGVSGTAKMAVQPCPAQSVVSPSAEFHYHDKTVQVATSGAGDNLLEEGVCRILRQAKSYVYIQTPYFCPTDTVLRALLQSAHRGVDVRILVPAEADTKLMTVANRAFFEECVEAGVTILTSPGAFNHSKTIVSDDYLSTIGSLNMDSRSQCINYEDMALIYDAEFAADCKALFLARSNDAHEVSAEEIASLPRQEKIGAISGAVIQGNCNNYRLM